MTATTQPPAAARGVGRALRPTGKVLPEHARAHNRSLVLAHLFHIGPASRADIARSTGLTRVTVSGLVADLIAEGLVEELGVRVEGKVGKPATLVGMRTEAFQIVAVDLTDDSRLLGAVMTLVGDVVVRRSVALEGRTGESAADLLETLCRELLAAATRPVIGVGIASPGVIDLDGHGRAGPQPGLVRHAARGQPDASASASRCTSPTTPTPARSASSPTARPPARAAWWSRSGRASAPGIVVDGALVLGRHHAAGEIGHVTVVDGDLRDEPPLDCACGRSGCLETVLSVPALRRRTAGLTPEESDAALASVGRLLGIALAPVVSALDLAEVLLSGPPELLDGPLREAALTTVRARTMPVIGQGLAMRMGSLDEDGALAGAAVLVLSGQLGVS